MNNFKRILTINLAGIFFVYKIYIVNFTFVESIKNTVLWKSIYQT